MSTAQVITTTGSSGVRYPSPFFDVGTTYQPTSVKSLFRFCQYYAANNPLVHGVIRKMAEYPITDFVFTNGDAESQEAMSSTFERLKIKSLCIDLGLHFFTFGNGFCSLSQSIIKRVTCPSCATSINLTSTASQVTIRSERGKPIVRVQKCEKCSKSFEVNQVEEVSLTGIDHISTLRWDPMSIDLDFNPITGAVRYKYNIPEKIKKKLRDGDRFLFSTTPSLFVEAAFQNKAVIIDANNFYHFRRSSTSADDSGWGAPLIQPVMKDLFQVAVMKKARECISPETLVESASGLVRADEVRIGDQLRTHMGAMKRVVDVFDRPLRDDEKAYDIRLTTQRDRKSVFSENHPILAIQRRIQCGAPNRMRSYPHRFPMGMVKAKDLKIGDYIAYPVHRVIEENQELDLSKFVSRSKTEEFVYREMSTNTAKAYEELEGRGSHLLGYGHRSQLAGDLQISTLDVKTAQNTLRNGHVRLMRMPRYIPLSEDLAYLAGWYIGDGSTTARAIVFTCALHEQREAQRIVKAFRRLFGCNATIKRSAYSRTLVVKIYDSIVAEFFRHWMPGTARSKRIPMEIERAPDSVLRAFLRGYAEADGHDNAKRDYISFTTTSEHLSSAVRRLLVSQGVIACEAHRDTSSYTSVLENGHVIHGLDTRSVNVAGHSARRLRELLWPSGKTPPTVEYGKSGFFRDGFLFTRISKHEECHVEKVIDYVVEDHHTFCVSGMAVSNCIAQSHIVPLWILFPSPNGQSNPFTTLNMSEWRAKVEAEFTAWKKDPNRICMMPLPLGFQFLGGDMKQLDPTPTIESLQIDIVAGMGVPVEFLRGGLSYTGSSVSLRILENGFINYRQMVLEYLNKFLIPVICRTLNLRPVTVDFTELRMADDIQQKQLLINLSAASKISDHALLDAFGMDYDEEMKLIEQELLVKSNIMASSTRNEIKNQAEIGEQQLRAEAELQKDKLQTFNMVMDPESMTDSYAQTLSGLKDPEEKANIMSRMQLEMPNVFNAVSERANNPRKPADKKGSSFGKPISLDPMSEKKAPTGVGKI